MPDIDLADKVVEAAKAFVQRATAAMGKRLDDFEERLKNIVLTPGPKGEPGERGEKGLDGAASTEPGPQGATGATGEQGPAGPQGVPGLAEIGPTGPQGVEGKGIEGPQGPQGAVGEQGLSIKGDTGDAGPQGPEGKSIEGPQGAPGPQGLAIKGDTGDMGPQGDRGIGEKGMDGRDGRDGNPGEPGRDALEIDVRDGIDEAKTYPRGTFATHDGGMIRAFKATTPIKDADSLAAAGWQVIVNGIADVQEAHSDDLRSIGLGFKTTNGKTFIVERTFPVVLYRGLFVEGQKYVTGDATTWDGSIWIALKDTEAVPGPGCDEWKLSVKRGREGKAGLAGTNGKDGKPGKDGRFS